MSNMYKYLKEVELRNNRSYDDLSHSHERQSCYRMCKCYECSQDSTEEVLDLMRRTLGKLERMLENADTKITQTTAKLICYEGENFHLREHVATLVAEQLAAKETKDTSVVETKASSPVSKKKKNRKRDAKDANKQTATTTTHERKLVPVFGAPIEIGGGAFASLSPPDDGVVEGSVSARVEGGASLIAALTGPITVVMNATVPGATVPGATVPGATVPCATDEVVAVPIMKAPTTWSKVVGAELVEQSRATTGNTSGITSGINEYDNDGNLFRRWY